MAISDHFEESVTGQSELSMGPPMGLNTAQVGVPVTHILQPSPPQGEGSP